MIGEPWIVPTKLHMPETPDPAVRRPRLTDLLDEGARRRLTVVCGPAGSGKSTLLAEWIRRRNDPVAWLSLDAYDNLFQRFWVHLTAALDKIHPHFYEQLAPALADLRPAAVQVLLFPLLNRLSAERKRFILVLDDFHAVTNPVVHRSFLYFLERLPPHIHCAVAARQEPPLPLPRFAADGQLVYVSGRQLNFTLDEGTEYCRLMDAGLTERQIGELMDRTEGWIAGVKLALLSRRTQDGTVRLSGWMPERSSGISDYLLQEVFMRLPREDRRFLLHTSILLKMNPSLCDEVTGRASGARTLERLERANLFVIPLDDRGEWFRYHHLFGEFLRRELARSEPASVPVLHLRAAGWFERNGMPADAVEHYLQGGHHEHALALIRRLLPGMLKFEWESLLRWMAALPEKWLERDPDVFLAYTFFNVAGLRDRNLVDALIRRCEELLAPDSGVWPAARRPEFLASLALIRALHAEDYLHDIDKAIFHMEECVRHMPEGIPFQEIEINPGEMCVNRAFCHSRRSYFQLERFFLVMIDLWGRGKSYVFTGFFHVALGEIRYERGQLVPAEQSVREGYDIALRHRSAKLLAPAAAALAKILWARASREDAYRVLDQAEQRLVRWGFDYWAHLLGGQRIRFWHMESGELPPERRRALEALVAETESLLPEDLRPEHFYAALTVARGWLMLDRLQEAASLLEMLAFHAHETQREADLQEIFILQAICCKRRGRLREAFARLRDALAIAERNRSVRPFLDETPELGELMRVYADGNKDASVFVRRLASGWTGRLASRPAADQLPEPLTWKEREVLELMAEGMSGRLIAERLGISVGTVKTHIHHIYQKLMVDNRWDAIQWAKSNLSL